MWVLLCGGGRSRNAKQSGKRNPSLMGTPQGTAGFAGYIAGGKKTSPCQNHYTQEKMLGGRSSPKRWGWPQVREKKKKVKMESPNKIKEKGCGGIPGTDGRRYSRTWRMESK